MTKFPIDRRSFLRTVGAGVLAGAGLNQTVGANQDNREPWRFETGGDVRSSPTVVGGTVFIGSYDGNVYALDASDGTEQWRFETRGKVYSSPRVVDETVFIGLPDGNLYALDAADGTEQWRFETGDSVDSSPTVVDGTVFVGSDDNNVYALDASDGTEQWHFETDSWVKSSPTVVDGTVFVGSYDDNVYALDAIDGTEQWCFETGDWVEPSPTVVDETVFVGSYDANVYALDASDGTEQWRFDTGDEQDFNFATQPPDGSPGGETPEIEPVVSSPTVADGTVFIAGNDGKVYGLDAADGTEQWHASTRAARESSPTVADNTVFVGGLDSLLELNASTGDFHRGFRTGLPVFSSPTVVDGTVFFGCHDRNVYAVDTDTQGSSEGSRVDLGTLGHHGETDPDSSSLPGFGVAAGVTTLGATSYLLKRRRDRSSTDDSGPQHTASE